ncbi:acyltransferase [Psychrobacillus sp. MER TA 171]|uniref:acyltransferase n=1 Tax=Psychrobacillus sp. MER TA 171 TaxID=2939577 RepID=UPI00203C208A|nr:acyltransferase [Psychrobacillus sp. MER TA 171]MCM3356572.1 acyltransferase [Psychrobacillus sp. MER TA 171]
MLSDFHGKLDKELGPRRILHIKECEVCGFDEIYYVDPETNKQIGMACEGCNFIRRFVDSTKTQSKGSSLIRH